MAQPVRRIFTAEQAVAAARALQTPSDVRAFLAMRQESSAVRAFIATEEWAAIHQRIIGDGSLPLDPHSIPELARMARWAADGELGGDVSPDARDAYLHMAREMELLAREMAEAAAPARLAAVPDAGERAA